LINATFNGFYLGTIEPMYTPEWLMDPRFIIGMLFVVSGFIINIQSDSILINLRKPGETGYKIPKGGMYRFVSCPNYLGEIMEWTGWAIATWSLPGLAFALWTAANLIPRALDNHRWYHSKFEDYPAERKAVLPYIV
jgi:protein-S-isoprenylcysteine O-methyltransferase Ste14